MALLLREPQSETALTNIIHQRTEGCIELDQRAEYLPRTVGPGGLGNPSTHQDFQFSYPVTKSPEYGA